MPFGSSESVDCRICNVLFTHYKKLSEHLKKEHQINPDEYYVRYYLDSVRPRCSVCDLEPRYVSLSKGFKKNCKEHARLSMSQGGIQGGHAPAWNKGKTKESDERVREFSVKFSGVNNPFYGKKHSDVTKLKNAAAHRLQFSEVIRRINEINPAIKVLSDWRSYDTQDSLLNLSCNVCDTQDTVSLFNLKRCWRCKKCNPLGSKQQLEVSDYIKSLGFDVENSTRGIISPLEIDVWIPQKNIGIEYHGLYWHSGGREEIFDKGKHRKKYEMCSKMGIKLIQFFSDEWIQKGDICRSIVKNALGVNELKLNARDCLVEEIDSNTAKSFLDKTHISGYTRSRHKFGLIHKEHGLVGIATTRIPIQKKWGKLLELARMSFSSGVSVRGGASKLLKRVKQSAVDEGFDGVLSYADLRFGEGEVYKNCGFILVGESSINYWYTDGHERHDRFKFRAQPGKSEVEVAKSEGVRTVWGAGNKIYVWNK